MNKFAPSSSKNQYIKNKSQELIEELTTHYNISSISSDAQFAEIAKGIAVLHANLEYNVEFEINNTLKNLQYNLPVEFNTPAYGLVQISTGKSLMIESNLVINSYESIYKTTNTSYINPLKITNLRVSGSLLEIELEGQISQYVDFFASSDIINSIFGCNEKIRIKDMYDMEYECTVHSIGSIYAHCAYNFLSYFRVRNISNKDISNITILKIPMFKYRNILQHSLSVNCAIIVNEFNTSFVVHNKIISANEDYNILKIQSVYDKDGHNIPSIKDSPQGWYVNTYNDCLFIDFKGINEKEVYVDVICENKSLNTRFCKFQNHLPVNTEWKIIPGKNDVNNKINMFDLLTYTTSNPMHIARKLFEQCNIEVTSIQNEKTVINTYFKDSYIPHIGWAITATIVNPNFILLRKIEEEMNRYHLTKLIIEDDGTGVIYDQVNTIIKYNL